MLTSITLTSTQNQKLNQDKNVTTINLGMCEDKLREYYNISHNDSLYILKIDVEQEGMKIPKIEYDIYSKLNGSKMIKLNLTQCDELKIELSIHVKINDSIDKYNSSSDYYNDICSTTISQNGTDISLNDRRDNFINKNLTLCQENCELIDYNYESQRATCSCEIKQETSLMSEMKIDTNKLKKNFKNINNFANFKLI